MKRYLKSFIYIFLPIFMIVIFGPTELFFANYAELGFTYGEFGWKFIAIGIALSLVLALILSLLPEKAAELVQALFVGGAVATYIQLMFLNKEIGQIGVTAEGYIPPLQKSILDGIIWAVIIIGAIVGTCVWKKKAQKVLLGIAGFLLAIQLVGMVSLFFTSDEKAFQYSEGELMLDMSQQFTISSDENIIVLLFDNCSNVWLDAAVEQYPDMLDCVSDFTYYNNADCNYYGTYPSIAHILTGKSLDTSLSVNDYLAQCWDNELTNQYYDLLHDHNYKVNVFMYQPEVIAGGNSLDILEGKVNNLTREDAAVAIDYPLLYKTLLQMSCFRYMPDALKPYFYVSNAQYAGIVSHPTNEMMYSNPNFYNALCENGLTVDDSSNYFVLNHLNGSHEFINDENCQYEDEPTRDQTIRGMFTLVEEYLNQIKEAGVYDNSTIIIMTDHGVSYNAQPMFMIKKRQEQHDKIQVTDAPITYDEFVPTIVAELGEYTATYGDTIDKYHSGDVRERVFYERALSGSYPTVRCYDDSAAGGANIWKKFVYTGNRDNLSWQYQADDCEVIPMVDSYY